MLQLRERNNGLTVKLEEKKMPTNDRVELPVPVDDGETIRWIVPQPFSFAENLKYLSRASNEIMHTIGDNRIYKAIPLGRETAVVELFAERDDTLAVRFVGSMAPADKAGRESVAAYVAEWFDLDANLLPFCELAKTDALLGGAVQDFHGLRMIGIPDLFEAMSWGIIGQQINLAFAYTLKRRLVEAFGRSVDAGGERHWIFPDAGTIAALNVADLAALRMTVKKCEYLIGTASLIAEGKLSKAQLQACSNAKAAEKLLLGIRGIGPWTANYVLMRCLRLPDAFPIDDVGLHNAIKLLTGADSKPSKQRLLQLSAPWRGWESYATFYLWRYLY